MLLIIIVLLVFCMSNLDPITVKLVGWESPQMPLFLILLFVFFFGFFLALFWQALRSVTMKKQFKPAPVLDKEPEVKKEKSGRKWGRSKKDISTVKEQQKETPEELASKDEKDSTPGSDEPVDVSVVEDK
jgi:hypothetical protein